MPLHCAITRTASYLVLALASFAAAQNITGTVTNGTTGKPAAGDEVTLLSLSQGMQEIGSTKTDAQGPLLVPRAGRQQARTWCAPRTKA